MKKWDLMLKNFSFSLAIILFFVSCEKEKPRVLSENVKKFNRELKIRAKNGSKRYKPSRRYVYIDKIIDEKEGRLYLKKRVRTYHLMSAGNYSYLIYKEIHMLMEELIGSDFTKNFTVQDMLFVLEQNLNLLDIMWEKVEKRIQMSSGIKEQYGFLKQQEFIIYQKFLYDKILEETEKKIHNLELQILRDKGDKKHLVSLQSKFAKITINKYKRFRSIETLCKHFSKDPALCDVSFYFDELYNNTWVTLEKNKRRKELLKEIQVKIEKKPLQLAEEINNFKRYLNSLESEIKKDQNYDKTHFEEGISLTSKYIIYFVFYLFFMFMVFRVL